MPVSLTYAELLRLIKYCGYVVAVIATAVLLLRLGELKNEPLKVIWQSITAGLFVPPLLIWALSKLKWKYPKLATLMGRRMVHGLWWGELRSEYRATPDADLMPPIPIAFVVRQSYFFLTIQSYTRGLPGESTMEKLTVEPRSTIGRLQYAFEMKRMRGAENKYTVGGGDLQLTSEDTRLQGFYWTSSPSQGHISLELLTRDCSGIGSFADAENARAKLLKAAGSAGA